MSSTHSKDEMMSLERGGVKIKLEKCTSEEENEDPVNAFDAAQSLEPQISSANCTSHSNSGEDSDSENNYCIVKAEEETVQINEVTPYTCEMCNATYDGLASYEVHFQDKHEMHNIIHTEENPNTSDECTSRFIACNSLKKHKRIHAGEKLFKCDECTSSFTQEYNLKKHKKVHTGERPYKCDECASDFTRKYDLKKHKLIHTGEKPYKCDKCTLRCTRMADLKKHKMIHTGERPYKCDECTSSFISTSHLNRHKMIHQL